MESTGKRLGIPEDVIMEEILSRLPVKSLVKFKSVSKSWYCLISSKKFIKTHLQKSKNKRIMKITRNPSWRIRHYSLPSFSYDDHSPDFHPQYLRFVGSCNGLICILIDRKYFMLWNPCTRESKKLPQFLAVEKHSYDNVMARRGYFSRYGFIYDDDYKVFAVMSMTRRSIAKVYSLKTDSWTEWGYGYGDHSSSDTDSVLQHIQSSSCGDIGQFASGKLHWYVESHSGQSPTIYAIDLSGTGKQVVNQPSNIEAGFLSKLRLGVLDGCLCLLYYYENEKRLDVWVCNEYGVGDSWVKKFSIPLIGPTSTPICTLPNDEVLLLNSSNFLVYNPKENKLRYSLIFISHKFHEVALYVESLVSLVPDHEQERLV